MEEMIKRFIKSQLDPVTGCMLVKDMGERIANEIMREDHILVKFTSSMGRDSKRALKTMGYEFVGWSGIDGLCGETQVWLPKSENIGDFIEKLKSSEIIDNDTPVTINGGKND